MTTSGPVEGAGRLPGPGMRGSDELDELDDFTKCKITRKQDWLDLYTLP